MTKPIGTSVAVWYIPLPIGAGEPFGVKIGVKSAGTHCMESATVEVLDELGAVRGSGKLGAKTWPDTKGLYWSEVALVAPLAEGRELWQVEAGDFRLPHGAASARSAST